MLPTNDDLSNEVMFEDDNTKVGSILMSNSFNILIPNAFNILQKPSSSKPFYDFGLSSSSSESKREEDIESNKHSSLKVTLESDESNEAQANPVDNSMPSKPHNDANNDDQKTYESSTSDIGSSTENIEDPFALLELRANVALAIFKVDSLDQKVIGLDLKLD
ncbi:unnamed protein product [Lactuca saligna]|uniref:Uncharacterized protein n=1 Tax=Lactuca saligna TaxID=75948 RepID=A0AA35V135_LACSI|nr:unnamed protein product [Lactuca saligna]